MENTMTTYGVKVIVNNMWDLDYMGIPRTTNKMYWIKDGNYMDNHKGLMIVSKMWEVKGKSNWTLGTNK
jgi:hypothetical protein